MFLTAVLMTDPAVAYLPGAGYPPYDNGKALDVWLKAGNGSASLGVVWPGRCLTVPTCANSKMDLK